MQALPPRHVHRRLVAEALVGESGIAATKALARRLPVAAFNPRPGISYVPVQGIEPSRVAIAWRQGDDRQTLHSFIATVRAVAAALPYSDAAVTASRKTDTP